MNSSVCLNKSILAVVMLVMACFAGVAVVDDVDAAGAEYTVKLDNKVEFPDDSGVFYDNAYFGNNVTLEDGVIVGSVTSSDEAKAAVADWYNVSLATQDKAYILVFTIQNLPQGYHVSFMADGALKSAAVGDGENLPTDLTIFYRVTDDNKSGKFTYAVTPAKQTGDSLAGLVTYDIPIDLKMDVIEKQIEYTINGLTIIDKVDSGTAYSLVALDALNQTVPAGQKFVGWSDGKNTYPVGTTLVISNVEDFKYQYVAVFEDLPAIVITFIDGTSKVAECNVTEIAAKVPAMEKVGYDFTGWYLNGVIVDPMTYTFTESAVLVAGWEPIKCFVTFTVDGEVYQKQTVEYNDFATQPVAPKGFQGWDFNFATPITGDITVEAIPEPAAEPTGADNPMTLTVYILAAFVIVGLIACFVYLLKEGKLVIGRGSKVAKVEAPAEEEPKQ